MNTQLNLHRNKTILLLFSLCWLSSPAWASNDLPVIGDASSSAISLDEEHKLGAAWIRVLRGRTEQLHDPFVYQYVDNLLYRLASHSALQDKRLQLILLKNRSLNAFAAPGGIIGINTGLFPYAKTESEFASVVAHELSHLSQRHYASSLEQQRRSLPLKIAAILGTILVAASSEGSDATAAAMASSQAALVDNQLAFSRQNEREADDIGMQVLSESGYDPKAMPEMFSQMQKSTRFLGDQLPEFLQTHPVTESRIADSLNRAAQLPTGGREDSLEYQFIRDRVLLSLGKDKNQLFQQYFQLHSDHPADRYMVAISGMQSQHMSDADKAIQQLEQAYPDNLYIKALRIEYWLADNNVNQAQQRLQQLLGLYPGHYPLSMLYLQALTLEGKHKAAIQLLKSQLRNRPNDPFLWHALAENYGLTDDILGVHRAQAEYYLLLGDTQKAEEHLKQALRMPNLSSQDKAMIQTRLKDTKDIRESLKF